MKNKVLFFVLSLALLFFYGCSKNPQASSKEEASFVIQHLPDFQEQIQYFSVESSGFIFIGFPNILQSEPDLKSNRDDRLVHVFIYRTKASSFKLIFMNDERPPKILQSREFK
jgi:hypothetical protein